MPAGHHTTHCVFRLPPDSRGGSADLIARRGALHTMSSTTPPSTRNAAPVVAEDSGEAT